MRVDAGLHSFIKEVAKQKETTVTALVVGFMKTLRTSSGGEVAAVTAELIRAAQESAAELAKDAVDEARLLSLYRRRVQQLADVIAAAVEKPGVLLELIDGQKRKS